MFFFNASKKVVIPGVIKTHPEQALAPIKDTFHSAEATSLQDLAARVEGRMNLLEDSLRRLWKNFEQSKPSQTFFQNAEQAPVPVPVPKPDPTIAFRRELDTIQRESAKMRSELNKLTNSRGSSNPR